MMSINEWSNPDEHFSSDACLEGLGAIDSDQYFHDTNNVSGPDFKSMNSC
jgi:hypothetical protein